MTLSATSFISDFITAIYSARSTPSPKDVAVSGGMDVFGDFISASYLLVFNAELTLWVTSGRRLHLRVLQRGLHRN